MKIFKSPKLNKNEEFYNKLMSKEEKSFWSTDKRFSVDKTLNSKSVKRYYVPFIKQNIRLTDDVLDVGCGAGNFLPIISSFAKSVIAIEPVDSFRENAIKECSKHNLNNVKIMKGDVLNLPFPDATFDVITLTDVIHHFESPDLSLKEINRVLKKDGKVVIFEPNVLNPLLWILCLFDKNEWGALALGRISLYIKLLRGKLRITHWEYSGLLVGPDNKFFRGIVMILLNPILQPYIGWLSPKYFILATKEEI